MVIRRNLTTLIGAPALALGWILAGTDIGARLGTIADALPEMVALPMIILAWRFRRSRLVVAAVTLAVAHQILRGPLAVELTSDGGPGLAAFAILMPVNLGVLVMLRDHPMSNPATLVHLILIGLQPLLVGRLLEFEQLTGAGWFALLRTGEASALAFLIAAVFALLALAIRRSALEVGMLWVLACAGLAVHGGYGVQGASILLGTAQLILLLGLVEDSYRLAFHDELTGLPGRRALNEALLGLNGKFALAMVDVDHFKRFNDRYGHEAGDQALKMVADCLMGVGGGGRAFRYGGEEFTVLFRGAAADGAEAAVEDLRKDIASRAFSIRSKKRPRKKPETPKKPKNPPKQVKLTVSIGLAKPNARRSSPDEVLRAADKLLYRAKKNGRNRVAK